MCTQCFGEKLANTDVNIRNANLKMADYCNLFEMVTRNGGGRAWHKKRILPGKVW